MLKLIIIFSLSYPEAPAVTSVPLVTMATQSKLVASASHASAMATLTLWILIHVTSGLANASSACTTRMAPPVLTVSSVTTAMLWPMTADVSESDSRY